MNEGGTTAGRRRATVTEAMRRLPGSGGERFAEVLEHGSMEVEIYAPRAPPPPRVATICKVKGEGMHPSA